MVTVANTANKEQAEILRLLLRSGSFVDEADLHGNTSLHLLLSKMRPEDRHCADSLEVLLAARADLHHRNVLGETALDIVCRVSPEFGSFRRDALRVALAQVERCQLYLASEGRLWTPPVFSGAYSKQDYAHLLDTAARCTRTRLINRLINSVECSGPYQGCRLHKAAADRSLQHFSRSTGCREAREQDVFSVALSYLMSMVEGKMQLCQIGRNLMRYQQWRPHFPTNVNWINSAEEAGAAAILGFDWSRPVDLEELFAVYVKHLDQQLEEIGGKCADLVKILEQALLANSAIKRRQDSTISPTEVEPKVMEEEVSERPSKASLKTEDEQYPSPPAIHVSELEADTPLQRTPPGQALAVVTNAYEVLPHSILPTPVDMYFDHGAACGKGEHAIDRSRHDSLSPGTNVRRSSIVGTPLDFYAPFAGPR
jgi:hypothetical protein